MSSFFALCLFYKPFSLLPFACCVSAFEAGCPSVMERLVTVAFYTPALAQFFLLAVFSHCPFTPACSMPEKSEKLAVNPVQSFP